ncbi:MAG TPA: NFACT family protein [Nitrospirota bacterium]|nr:NFACT family protein [Nitrospirota bacterium]
MDFQILQKVVDELSTLITGARVDRLYQGFGGELYLVLHRRRNNAVLLISPDRSMPRLHLVSAKPPAVHALTGFAQYLKSRVTGAVISAIVLLNQDRIAEIRFSKAGAEYRLVIELTGSSANLILTDASYSILAVRHAVAFAENVSRPLLQGLQYVVPAKRPHGAVSGKRAPDATEGTSAPVDDADRAFNRAAEAFYERLIEQRDVASLRTRLSTVVRQARSKVERRITALSEDLRSADRADEYRQAGELILSHIGQLATGMKHAELAGYDGRMVAVRLEPQRSPAQNAERYFKKYKKAKAGREIISTRLQHSQEEASYLKSVSIDIDHAPDREGLVRIHSELVVRRYIMQRGNGANAARSEPKGVPIRKILCLGWEVLVGKSALGNDYITTKLARPDDLWLHAEGMPGSHVLIRNPGRTDIPEDVFMKAASLAAFYSKGRKAAKVPITYAHARFVKKPRGAKPGLVVLLERKVIMAAPEEI